MGYSAGFVPKQKMGKKDSGGAMRSVGATLPLYLDVDPRSKRGSTQGRQCNILG